uniref:T-box domain-containing protein n=1 Tax=Caenorhabditis tropicalis TaxID=1561998 RepID=A0A1I7TMI5_9PELO
MSNEVSLSLSPSQDELWKTFHARVNEMIVTKAGRNFFPKLEYIVTGLDPQKLYAIMIQIKPVDEFRYRFTNEWIQSAKPDPQAEIKKAYHPDGVRSGKEWMEKPVCFEKVKITHYVSTDAWIITLLSMHKYVPVITIYETLSSNPFVATSSNQVVISTSIPHTEFIAVTAYQNPYVADLKIKYNSYAKAYRKENQENNRKRRTPSTADYSADESNSNSPQPPKSSRASSSSPPALNSFPSFPFTINPFLFPFPNFTQTTPPTLIPPLTFPFQLFPFLNPHSVSLPSGSVEEQPEIPEEEIDIMH